MTPLPERARRQPTAGDDGRAAVDAAAVVADLPPPLWDALLPLFRRAVDDFARSELPAAVRPFLGWKPDRMLARRPRTAIAAAIAGDPRIREAIGRLHRKGSRPSGPAETVVDLVVDARWEDLLALSTRVADERAAREDAAAETAASRSVRAAEDARRRLQEDVREVRGERDALRVEAAQAIRRAEVAEAERDDASRAVEELRSQVAELAEELASERRRGAERIERLRRRLTEAQARARIDEARARRIADGLVTMGRDLTEALQAPASGPDGRADPDQADDVGPGRSADPTAAPPVAVPGRPCRMPPGLANDSPLGVGALLRAPGLLLLVDGYNVSKDARGPTGVDIEQQRRWLVRLCEMVATRFGCRVVAVFDGQDRHAGPGPSSRSVTTVFSSEGETADDRIVAIVDERDRDRPVLVVTSDRDLVARVEELGADVAASGVFLEAVTPRP